MDPHEDQVGGRGDPEIINAGSGDRVGRTVCAILQIEVCQIINAMMQTPVQS